MTTYIYTERKKKRIFTLSNICITDNYYIVFEYESVFEMLNIHI